MSSQPPLNPTIVSPSESSTSGGTSPIPPVPSAPPVRSFWIWWLFKKWAWRNTAGIIWLALLYSAIRGFGPTFGASLPSITSTLPTEGHGRVLTLAVVVWLLAICELQLTQLITFAVYAVALPFWLPFLAGFHYYRNRFGSPPIKAAPIKLTAVRVGAAVIFGGLYLWWPLPSRPIAFVLGVLALAPGFLLLRHTFRFCVTPGVWMRDLRSAAHKIYETFKTTDDTLGPGASSETSARVEGWKRGFIAKYEYAILGGIERGLLRKTIVFYLFALLLACLLYLGFTAALFLRAFTNSPEALASAFGRRELPNLLSMAAVCSLGVLGQLRINDTFLSPAGATVVLVLRLMGSAAGVAFISTFYGGYSTDIGRAESRPEETPKGGV
jgi:hypothetical protein